MRLFRISLLALALATAPVALAVLAPGAACAQATPAKIATGVQIVTNLHLYDLLLYGGRIGVMKNEALANLPQADKDRILVLFGEEMSTRRSDTIRLMAEANVAPYSVQQLNDLLDLSKIKYVQDLVLAGGDASLATPNENSMTAAERALFTRLMAESWVIDFFTKFDYSTAAPNVAAAAQAAMTRYEAGT